MCDAGLVRFHQVVLLYWAYWLRCNAIRYLYLGYVFLHIINLDSLEHE